MRHLLAPLAVVLALTAAGCSGRADETAPASSEPIDPAAFDTTWEFPGVTMAANVEQVVGRRGVQGAVQVAEVAVRDWMANTAVLDYESSYQISDFDGLRRLLTREARTAFDRSLQSSLDTFADENGTPTQATQDVQALALYRLDGDSEFPQDGGPWVVDPRMDRISVSLSEDGTPVVMIAATVTLRLLDPDNRPVLATVSRETSFSLTRVGGEWRIYSWTGKVTGASTRPGGG